MVIYAVGTKGRDFFTRRNYEIAEDYSEVINEPMYSDAMEIGSRVLKDLRKAE